MQPVRIALVQLAWPGSRDAMIPVYERLIAEAAARGAGLVCLPEFSLSPYFAGTTDPAGFAWAESLHGGESDAFFMQMAQTHGVALIGSLFEKTPDGTLYDTAVLYDAAGAQVGITRKVHIPSGDGYNETHFFGGHSEFPVHTLAGVQVAAPTCYDQWFPELARIYALNGAEFVFYPTAIGSEPTDPAIDTAEAWCTVMRGHAIANGLYVAAANRVGVENGVTFYGSSFICDPTGRVLAQAGRDTTEVITADLDPAVQAHWRDLLPLLHQRRPDVYGPILGRYGDRDARIEPGQM
jgi:N-carbamoylputrescine amidase